MKEQLINDTCMLFAKAVPDIDLQTVRNILELSLAECEITKYSKAVTVYAGEPTEKILKAFVVSKKVAGASDRTVKHYGFVLRHVFDRIQKPIYDITTNDIRIYFAHRELEDKVSAVTRNNERNTLCSFFQWMTEEGLVDKNPMSRVPKIKEPKIQKKAFTPYELECLRANCKNEREAAVLEILISTGCRVSELCGIRLSDIDGDSVIVHGKGNKERTCYLTARAQVAIRDYKKTADFRRRHASGCEYLFARNGKPISPSGVQSITRRIGESAGIEDCHPHRFRRTCATLALERGMPIERVSYMLGHESLDTTKIYLDLNDEGMKAAHKKYVC